MRTCSRRESGFTLVEVIVVAVIVAVLAGVAIPVYMNYIERSRTNSVSNTAGAIASFCGSCLNSDGVLSLSGALSGSLDGSDIQPRDDGSTKLVCIAEGEGDDPDSTSIRVPKKTVITFAHFDEPGNASVTARYDAKINPGKPQTVSY